MDFHSDASALERWRAAAMAIHHAGAGVYTFNFFPEKVDPIFSLLNEMGDQSTLKGNRTYGLDNIATDPLHAGPESGLDALSARVLRGNPYGAPDLRWSDNIPEPLPKVLVASWNDFSVAIGEDFTANPPKSTELIIGKVPSKPNDSDWVEVQINGALTTPAGGVHPDANGMCNCPFNANLIRAGMNSISVQLDIRGPHDPNPRILVVLDLLAKW